MTYQIADQPIDSSLRDHVVRPGAPLLAVMLCGTWLAWPWFAFNAIAMGSPFGLQGTITSGIIIVLYIVRTIVAAIRRSP